MEKLNQTFAVRLPRRDESLTSGTLFLRLSIMMLPSRQRCSSPFVTLTLTVDSSFGTWQLFFFLCSSAVRHGGRFDSGLRSSSLLVRPVLGSLVVLTGKPHYGCLSILHGPTASIYAVIRHWLLLWVASFLFLGGSSLIFFRCKFNASGDRQVLVTSSLFLPKFYGSLPHFLNANKVAKENGVFHKICS